MKSNLNQINFDSPVEVIDPKSGNFQQDIARKAGTLADAMLEKAMEEDEVRIMATALSAYSKYKTALDNDTSTILDKIAQMSEKQLIALEKAMKQKTIIENIKSGKYSLEDIYSLPSKKKKK